MLLSVLQARNYRCLHDVTITLESLNLFTGPAASGKSTILDTLQFLATAVRKQNFQLPLFSRGGIRNLGNLARKGEDTRQIELLTRFEDQDKAYEWKVRLTEEAYGSPYEFSVQESLSLVSSPVPPTLLLWAAKGRGWWWSGQLNSRVSLAQNPAVCALAVASADETFPARHIAEFVSHYEVFDPHPLLLRRNWNGFGGCRLDSYGRNLAERLFSIRQSSPATFEQIVSATKSVLKLPSQIEIEAHESTNGFYLSQRAEGYTIHQTGMSGGTLRALALMTALLGEANSRLIGVEEPEHNIHPAGLTELAGHFLAMQDKAQLIITTKSPFLLDYRLRPTTVYYTWHTTAQGTGLTPRYAKGGLLPQ